MSLPHDGNIGRTDPDRNPARRKRPAGQQWPRGPAGPSGPGPWGQDLWVSSWRTVEQADITTFAKLTGDRQWIHVDPERAKTGRFGTRCSTVFSRSGRPPDSSGRFAPSTDSAPC
ncbi:MAG: MaoC/PaaZ C-terminal domain-containing protein [Mycobacterium sp.]